MESVGVRTWWVLVRKIFPGAPSRTKRKRSRCRGAAGRFEQPLPSKSIPFSPVPMPRAASPKKARSRKDAAVDPRFDWRRIAYHVLVSRALDDLEEATNRNRGTVP